jgi:hypothetical protein
MPNIPVSVFPALTLNAGCSTDKLGRFINKVRKALLLKTQPSACRTHLSLCTHSRPLHALFRFVSFATTTTAQPTTAGTCKDWTTSPFWPTKAVFELQGLDYKNNIGKRIGNMSTKRVASSPMETEKKKVSPFNEENTSMSSSSPTTHGTISYAEAERSPGWGLGPRTRRTTVSTLPIPEEGHLATTEGAIRNNFTVDILKRNGEDYRGTMKRTEAFISIFIGALGFDKEEFLMEQQAAVTKSMEGSKDKDSTLPKEAEKTPGQHGVEAEGGGEEVVKVSKAVEDMTIEELEKVLSVRKKGRPSNLERKEKAAKQKELEKKKARGNDPAKE